VLGPGLAEAREVLATEKSQAMPISCPPPMRMPLTRQITGLSQCRIAADHVVEQPHVLAVLLRPAGVVLGVLDLVLPPVQNALSPVPVNTTATHVRSFDAARMPRITPFTIAVV
jgi:hypothetical protein